MRETFPVLIGTLVSQTALNILALVLLGGIIVSTTTMSSQMSRIGPSLLAYERDARAVKSPSGAELREAERRRRELRIPDRVEPVVDPIGKDAPDRVPQLVG